MTLSRNYDASAAESRIQHAWADEGIYRFQADGNKPVYAIDTPPPSVSGHLHLGHCYSYAHADFFARYRRMQGDNVFYPMGFDDNGLPTERLVERETGTRAADIGRSAFIRQCLAVSEAAELQYADLWRRLGLSIDWDFTYRTIDDESRRLSQWGFLDLVRKGLVYQRHSPAIWCPECRTAIAQAELNDLEKSTQFYTLAFGLDDGQLPIATTRPELLPACVSLFVHPDDGRFAHLIGQEATVPLQVRRVPILSDRGADPAKGTGVVMCCTFGDTADINWWRMYDLPLIEVIGRDGRMNDTAGPYAGSTTNEARRMIVDDLANAGLLLSRQTIDHTVRVHERCDTPVEYIPTRQWFIRILDRKSEFLEAGERISWFPEHFKTRYSQWVENLNWDWCISRQRYFGVSFPVWYCAECGQPIFPNDEDLPVDPIEDVPGKSCSCGGSEYLPETDVMDTWATSSLSPQIVGQMLTNPPLYKQVFPMALRPQAHEIIRTWAFYTIVRSIYHTGQLPWQSVAISGWGLAAGGEEKLSKSRGSDTLSPMETLERYSADAVRYWAASTALGKDAVISETRIQSGAKWATKLWHVARFSERFLAGYRLPTTPPTGLTTADSWLLARMNQLVESVTKAFNHYDYATAKNDIEEFFWRDLADNYLEMAKKRLYDGSTGYEPARFTLSTALLVTIKLLAPLMPYITEAIYRELFAGVGEVGSIHRAAWPIPDGRFSNVAAIEAGNVLLDIATTVRRFKSERNLPLGAELDRIDLAIPSPALHSAILAAEDDLLSLSRARVIVFIDAMESDSWIQSGPFSIRISH